MKKLTRFFTAVLALALSASVSYAAGATLQRGDVDGDGIVAVSDSTQIKRYLNGGASIFDDATIEIEKAADVNQNERVDLGDAIAIQRNLNGMTSPMDLPYSVSSVSVKLADTGLQDYMSDETPYYGDIAGAFEVVYDSELPSDYDGTVIIRCNPSDVATVVGYNEDTGWYTTLSFEPIENGLKVACSNSESSVLFTKIYCMTPQPDQTPIPQKMLVTYEEWGKADVEVGSRLITYNKQNAEVTSSFVIDNCEVRILYSDGTTRWAPLKSIKLSREYAPAEAGPFELELSYQEGDAVVRATLELNAYIGEPVIDSATFNKYMTQSHPYTRLIFTDAGLPTDESTIGDQIYLSKHVIGYWLADDETTFYVTSTTPGRKPIAEEKANYKLSGIHEIDARGLDMSRSTSVFPFYNAGNGMKNQTVEIVNLSGCDFSNVTNATQAFASMSMLREVDLSNCDFSNLENATYMFQNTPWLQKVTFDGVAMTPGKLKDISYMFSLPSSLPSYDTEFDISDLETSGVTDASGMFNGRKTTTAIDLSQNDFSRLKNANSMFNDCYVLSDLKMPVNGMPALENISHMFASCKALRDVDLSGLCFDNVTDIRAAFYYVFHLNTTLNMNLANLTEEFGNHYGFATEDDANVIINCPQATKEILEAGFGSSSLKHITFNIVD